MHHLLGLKVFHILLHNWLRDEGNNWQLCWGNALQHKSLLLTTRNQSYVMQLTTMEAGFWLSKEVKENGLVTQYWESSTWAHGRSLIYVCKVDSSIHFRKGISSNYFRSMFIHLDWLPLCNLKRQICNLLYYMTSYTHCQKTELLV